MFLESIKNPEDIKKLQVKELPVLTEEIRKKIIATVKENGGHLSSNLGIAETTVAINYVFDIPKDKVIYDVGHQCYAHKLLTGRQDDFYTLRQKDGVSGFLSKGESPCDVVSTGHAGSSLSQSIGLAVARDALKQDYYVIDVIGDGSLINGMAMEACATSHKKPNKFIVILNDNGMSISPNENGLYKALSKVTVTKGYLKTKKVAKKMFVGVFGKFLRKVRGALKRLFNPFNFIEKLGFKYVGIIDGNDVLAMVKALQKIKNSKKPVFLHIKTVKGKGYDQAESMAEVYHGIGKNMQCTDSTFSRIAGETLIKFAKEDQRIFAITAGMTFGTGLKEYSDLFPDRFKDVGIAEEHAVAFAGGLANGGLRPVVCIYSTFLQRAYDQIIEDVCLDNQPVIFLIDRNGLVGNDGKTHQGVFAFSYLRNIPNLTVFSPINRKEFEDMFGYALKLSSPVAILYPNGNCENDVTSVENTPLPMWTFVKEGCDVAILATDVRMLKCALEVSNKCKLSVAVINARTIKPLDTITLNLIKKMKVVTLEENVLEGGFGSAVLEYYGKMKTDVKVLNIGIENGFVPHATVNEQLKSCGLDGDSIYNKVLDFIGIV